jgi:transcriptional regulator with XRE-family HTH domain
MLILYLIVLFRIFMKTISTPEELEKLLGEDIKALRLQKNIDRKTLCIRAGISEHAIRNLEGGKGTTLKTLIRILKALERESWLNTIAPRTSINPLHLVRKKIHRQRARRKKHAEEKI